MHDQAVEYRASLAAISEVRETGVPREQIEANFEYDGWTELLLVGYVNNPHIRWPADAYRAVPLRVPTDCISFMESWTPRIEAKYLLTSEPLACFATTGLQVVQYRTWLPPYVREVRVQQSR